MRLLITSAITIGTLAPLALAAWPTTAPSAGQSFRVQGNQSPATQRGDYWYWNNFAVDESPLPLGYVAPTPVGAYEIKTYPTVRRADFDSSNLWLPDLMGVSRAFWTLFNHIKDNKIPMTSPVEMEYRGLRKSSGFFGTTSADSWTMGFLYRTPELGPVGTTSSGVVVSDKSQITVLSLGVEGDSKNSLDIIGNAVDQLKALLATQTTWVQAGEPRSFGYNSPMHSTQWVEVQIPVTLATTA